MSSVLPPSVCIEVDRARATIERSLGPRTVERLGDGLIELQARGADVALLNAVVRRLASASQYLSTPGALEDWLCAVREVVTQARSCTWALLENCEEILRHGSAAEFLMWSRTGLRHGKVLEGADLRAALAHFELRSNGSASTVSADAEPVNFATSRGRLVYLLKLLFDISPALLSVDQGLATRRPYLSNLGLHLPEAGRALRGSAARLWYDAAAAHAAAHLVYSNGKFARGALKPIQIALLGTLEDARVELLAIRELPGLRRLWLHHHRATYEHGDSFPVLLLRLARSLLAPDVEDPHPWVRKGRALFVQAVEAGDAIQLVAPTVLRDIASRLGNDIGQMRLQFNYREYVVEPPYRDDNAHLWEDEDEVTAQPAATTERSRQPPEEVRPTEHRQLVQEPSITLARFQYAEWDRLIGAHRSAWCTVQEGLLEPGDPRELQLFVDRHRAMLHRLQQLLRGGRLRERVTFRGQPRGDDLDVDAAVRSLIERRLRHTPGEKVHLRTARRERDVAALLLLDASTSTADLAPSGGSVLDLARRAALATALTLTEAGDCCAVDAFCSNGRHEIDYQLAMEFGTVVSGDAVGRLAAIASRWSTRMGAALRHATFRLQAQRQQRRLLVLITDGEPHDIDIHDRRYLIEDARRAVLEARRLGVNVFCVTLDAAADDYVRRIFGLGNYRVLDRIETLPKLLPPMVMQLTR